MGQCRTLDAVTIACNYSDYSDNTIPMSLFIWNKKISLAL